VGAGDNQEIERKFLVVARPEGLDAAPAERIDQGYVVIAPDGREVRVRRRGDVRRLTIKAGAGRTRTEVELPLDEQQFDALWPLTEGARVEKTRAELPLDGGLVAEVDVYGGALEGLVVAEIEFPSEAAADAFEPPPWLGPEVTDDRRYKNQHLARHGRPPADE
jgi:adenylate cyclase